VLCESDCSHPSSGLKSGLRWSGMHVEYQSKHNTELQASASAGKASKMHLPMYLSMRNLLVLAVHDLSFRPHQAFTLELCRKQQAEVSTCDGSLRRLWPLHLPIILPGRMHGPLHESLAPIHKCDRHTKYRSCIGCAACYLHIQSFENRKLEYRGSVMTCLWLGRL
jgi:hypothetical protein